MYNRYCISGMTTQISLSLHHSINLSYILHPSICNMHVCKMCVYNTLYCCHLFSQVWQYTLKHAPSQHLSISCETVQATEALRLTHACQAASTLACIFQPHSSSTATPSHLSSFLKNIYSLPFLISPNNVYSSQTKLPFLSPPHK